MVLVIVLIIDFFLFYYLSHPASIPTSIEISKNNHSIDKKHNTHTQQHHKVTLYTRPCDQSRSVYIIRNGEVSQPHVQDIESQRCDQYGNQQVRRPELCMRWQLERHNHDNGRVYGQTYQPIIGIDASVVDGNLANNVQSKKEDNYRLEHSLKHPC